MTLQHIIQIRFLKLNGVLIVADRGSYMEQRCTKEIDTKCKCREGFAPWGDDTSTCKCEPGFGLTGQGR